MCKRILLARCKGIPLTNVCGTLIPRSVYERIMMGGLCKRVLMWNLYERLTSGHERIMMGGLCERVLMWNLCERLTSGHERKMIRSLCKRVFV